MNIIIQKTMENQKKISIWTIITIIVVVIIGIILINSSKKGNNEVQQQVQQQSTSSTKENKTEEFTSKLEDGTKVNTSNKLSETKTFQGLKITNIQLTNKDNKTELIADIENPTTKDTGAMLVNVVLYDKNKTTIATIGGRISPIKAGGKTQFSTTAMIDYTNIYDFEFKLK